MSNYFYYEGVITQKNRLPVRPDEFNIENAKNNIDGHGYMRKFFEIPDTALNTDQDIWDYASVEPLYTYTASSGADYYLFSSSAADTQIVVAYLLDDNFDLQQKVITLNGQTPVKVGGTTDKFTRIYRMFNAGSTNFVGNIFCTEGNSVTAGAPDNTADVRAYIAIGNNQTLMSHYTIPNGTYGALLSYSGSITSKAAAAASITAYARLEGSVFRVQDIVGINSAGSGFIQMRFETPIIIYPKTDIKLISNCGTINTTISGAYFIVLFKTAEVNKGKNRILT
jgi:hypothetical protein